MDRERRAPPPFRRPAAVRDPGGTSAERKAARLESRWGRRSNPKAGTASDSSLRRFSPPLRGRRTPALIKGADANGPPFRVVTALQSMAPNVPDGRFLSPPRRVAGQRGTRTASPRSGRSLSYRDAAARNKNHGSRVEKHNAGNTAGTADREARARESARAVALKTRHSQSPSVTLIFVE